MPPHLDYEWQLRTRGHHTIAGVDEVGRGCWAGPVVAALLCHGFGFYGEEALVLILSAAFPTAVNIALLAHEFQADPQFAAAVVFYSTLASMVTVTCLIAVLRVPEVLAFF